jgi:tetratricopeptide (TPR) repeat protein
MKSTDLLEQDLLKQDLSEQEHDQRPPDASIFQLPQKRRSIFCLLLVLATIALYNPLTRAPFLNFDDAAHVTDNPHVRAGLTWKTVVWAFETSETSDWHPITWLSHALDCQLFGLNPSGPHTINVLLHAANVVLLFLILESATSLAWRSLVVAALFALHPINVESVAWVSERKTVLSMLFFLLALAAYSWYARRPGVGRYMAVTLAYALGLMSKAQVITFPFALLLLDYWPLGRFGQSSWQRSGQGLGRPGEADRELAGAADRGPSSFVSLIWEKVPWFALSAVSAVITMKVEAPATQSKLPLWIHLGNAALAYVKYLRRAFWPVNLALIYPHPEGSISIRAVALSAFAIIAITILAVLFRQRRPYFVGWFWFLGTLVPMIGLVQIGVHAMADRYAYIPLLGIFVIVCWGAADLIKIWPVPAAVSFAGAAAILLTLAIALHQQVGFWGDNVTLWTHTLEITEGNYSAEDNLATALIAQGRIEEAIPHLLRARFLRPDDALATINIATYEQMHGNYQAAIDGYARIPQFTKDLSLWVTARVNSGYAHYSLKQYDSAKQDFEAALNQQPENSLAYRGLGLVAQRAGDITRATKDYERSVELQPSPVGYLFLAQALDIGGQAEAARVAQSQAVRMSRDLNDDTDTVRQFLPK